MTWHMVLTFLRGEQPAPLPGIAGRRIRAHDEPLPIAELREIDDAREIACIAGISHAKALAMQQRWRAEVKAQRGAVTSEDA